MGFGFGDVKDFQFKLFSDTYQNSFILSFSFSFNGGNFGLEGRNLFQFGVIWLFCFVLILILWREPETWSIEKARTFAALQITIQISAILIFRTRLDWTAMDPIIPILLGLLQRFGPFTVPLSCTYQIGKFL